MPQPTKPVAPTVPLRTQAPATFSANVDGFLTYIPTAATFMDEAGDWCDERATDADDSAIASAASSVESASSASASASSAASAAASANFKGEWSGLTGALNKPATVRHLSIYWQLLNNLADVTLSVPGFGNADWAPTVTRAVKPLTASATLSVYEPNELQDGSAFVVPLANSVPVNWYIDIEQPKAFEAFKPTLVRSGADTFLDDGGTDTSITFQAPTSIRITSDGVSQWRL